MKSSINHKAVIVSAILYQVVGFIWYQVIFSSLWLTSSGVSTADIEKMGASPHIIALIGAFIFAYVFAYLQSKLNNNLKTGLFVIVLLWLGVTLPDSIPHYTFLSIPNTVLIVDTLHTLVAMLVAGSIILLWKNKQSINN
jgi:FtsH-binding integral membrane protein